MDAFRRADEVLLQAVQGITDLITTPGVINLDFADVTTVMRGRGVALMGIGMGEGPDAASKAMREALDYKLLEENSITGAKAALINVTGGANMPLARDRGRDRDDRSGSLTITQTSSGAMLSVKISATE